MLRVYFFLFFNGRAALERRNSSSLLSSSFVFGIFIMLVRCGRSNLTEGPPTPNLLRRRYARQSLLERLPQLFRSGVRRLLDLLHLVEEQPRFL